MSFDFYTSDTHFCHENVLNFEKLRRPFKNIEEHDEELIRLWNATVRPKDRVLHLGDLCFKAGTSLDLVMPRLNGVKTLLLGNHDTLPARRYLEHFRDVKSVFEDKKLGILFSHYPVHPSQLEFRYKVNVHGHMHGEQVMIQPVGCRGLVRDSRYINICVEHTGLAPVSRAQLLARVCECL